MTALQLATLAILDKADQYTWSVHGFGLLRLYVRHVGRIHIWHSALRYPGVSMIHNHSWDLHSTVVFGGLVNTRYVEAPTPDPVLGPTHYKRRLVTGYQHSWTAPPEQVQLNIVSQEFYVPGDVYAQRAQEIHLTEADDNTITVMQRNEDTRGEADVYWPMGTEWGNAQPREATPMEVHGIVTLALRRIEAHYDAR